MHKRKNSQATLLSSPVDRVGSAWRSRLTAGDGAAVSKETELQLRATDAAALLLFDLA